MSSRPIHVVLADKPVVCAGLKAVLSSARDIVIDDEAGSSGKTMRLVQALTPDVVVMDLAIARSKSADLIRHIMERSPRTRVVVLASDSATGYLLPVMDAGATGFLSRAIAHRHAADAIRTVAGGDVYVSHEVARSIARSTRIQQQLATQQFLEFYGAKDGAGRKADKSKVSTTERLRPKH